MLNPNMETTRCRDFVDCRSGWRARLHASTGSAMLVRLGSIGEPKPYLNREFLQAKLIDVHTRQVDLPEVTDASRSGQ